MSPTVLVANPAAGLGVGAEISERAATLMDEHRVDHRIVVPASTHEFTATLADLAAEGTERVVVVGGDGTVHHAANALAGTDTILGIIPAGSGNDIVRSLGISRGVRAAVAQSLEPAAAIDLLHIGSRRAVSVATIGFSVDVNRRANTIATRLAKYRLRSMRYNIATALEIPELKGLSLDAVLDGEPLAVEAALLAFGNTGMFGGGMLVAPHADPTDGLIDMVAIGLVSPARFATLLPMVFSGAHVNRPEVSSHRAAHIELAGAPGTPADGAEVWADGEHVASLPVQISIEREALHVAGVRKHESR